MSYDPDGAIKVLQDGLAPGLPHTFAQADGLVSFVRCGVVVVRPVHWIDAWLSFPAVCSSFLS